MVTTIVSFVLWFFLVTGLNWFVHKSTISDKIYNAFYVEGHRNLLTKLFECSICSFFWLAAISAQVAHLFPSFGWLDVAPSYGATGLTRIPVSLALGFVLLGFNNLLNKFTPDNE
jgi:hypothetical protein